MGPAPKQPRYAQDQVPPQPETRQSTNTTHDTAHAPPPRAKKSKTPQNKKGEKRRTVCHGCTFLAVPTTGIKTLSTDAWIHWSVMWFASLLGCPKRRRHVARSNSWFFPLVFPGALSGVRPVRACRSVAVQRRPATELRK